MKYDSRKSSTEEQALIRRLSVQRVFDGEGACDVTKDYELSEKVILKWIKKAKAHCLESLAPLSRNGRPRELTEMEKQEVRN